MARNGAVRPVDDPEIIKMAKYIYKAKYYTEQTGALDRNFNNKHKYSNKIKSNNIEVGVLTEPKDLDRRKHSISSQTPDEQPQNVFVSEIPKELALDLNYNSSQKPNTTDGKTLRKNLKLKLPKRKTTKHLISPDFHMHNSTKHGNGNETYDNNEPIDELQLRHMKTIYAGNTLKYEVANQDSYTYYPPELAKLYKYIPRYGSQLTEISSDFALHSFDYIYVSGFVK